MYIENKKIKEKFLGIFSENKDKVFIVDAFKDKSYTFGEFLSFSLKVGSFLKKNNVVSGDRIVYLLPNSIVAAFFYFASIFIGAIAVPINPAYNLRDIEFIIKSVNPRLVVTTTNQIHKIKNMCREESIVLVAGSIQEAKDAKGSIVFTSDAIVKNSEIKPFDGVKEDNPCSVVIYTSGTTSRPKGIMRSLSNFINNALAFSSELDINSDSRFLNILPMAYLGGYYNLLLLPFSVGASIVIWESFGPRTPLFFWDIVEKHKVNTLWFVPTIMAIMLELDRTNKGYELCQKIVKRTLVGTAPLPNTLKRNFEDKYGIKLYENYGLSETLFISTESSRYISAEMSVGRVVDGVEVVIKDDKGNIMPVNKEGEIWVKSHYLMEGYYSQDADGPEVLSKEELFPTGDIGYVAPKGELFITGRKKDLIIKGGVNVSPKAIEDILYEYPHIEEVAVVGGPHDIYGEDIVAVLRMKKGVNFEKETEKIKEFCKVNLSSVQIPNHFFEIEELPKSPTGKIQKYKIKNMLLAKMKFSSLSDKEIGQSQSSPNNLFMVVSKVKTEVERPAKDVIEAFKSFSTSIISDCFNRLRVMNGIKPLVKGRHFVGSAFTVEEVEGGNLMSHIALEHICAGDVLVIDGKGVTSRSCWGGLQTKCAEKKKVAAIVINGVVRDFNEIENSRIPVYCLGTSSAGPLKGWGGFINFPIACSGVPVLPGDIVVGDDDGVVVIPQEFAKEVLGYCKERLKKEEKWLQRIGEGEKTRDIVGLNEIIKRLNIQFLHKNADAANE